jgi:DNA repair exonuclease SbcCD ATPase subunit
VARKLLAYHEQLRQWSPAELGQEVTRLNAFVAANASSASPSLVMELSLALAYTRNNGDLARAVVLLDPIVKSIQPELQPWQPMARLLQARFAEQRRLEEQVERLNAQLRESQRNLQQTNDKLEALKAIERSLTPRPPSAPAPLPASAPKAP